MRGRLAFAIALLILAQLAHGQPALPQRDETYKPKIVDSWLLRNKVVRAELKLTPEQQKIVQEAEEFRTPAMVISGSNTPEEQKKLQEENRKAQEADMKRRDEAWARLEKSLSPAQQERLWQIGLQRTGITAVLDPEVQKRLKATDSQARQLRQAYAEAFAEVEKRQREARTASKYTDLTLPAEERVKLYREEREAMRAHNKMAGCRRALGSRGETDSHPRAAGRVREAPRRAF